jgi:hypothetical protein
MQGAWYLATGEQLGLSEQQLVDCRWAGCGGWGGGGVGVEVCVRVWAEHPLGAPGALRCCWGRAQARQRPGALAPAANTSTSPPCAPDHAPSAAPPRPCSWDYGNNGCGGGEMEPAIQCAPRARCSCSAAPLQSPPGLLCRRLGTAVCRPRSALCPPARAPAPPLALAQVQLGPRRHGPGRRLPVHGSQRLLQVCVCVWLCACGCVCGWVGGWVGVGVGVWGCGCGWVGGWMCAQGAGRPEWLRP